VPGVANTSESPGNLANSGWIVADPAGNCQRYPWRESGGFPLRTVCAIRRPAEVERRGEQEFQRRLIWIYGIPTEDWGPWSALFLEYERVSRAVPESRRSLFLLELLLSQSGVSNLRIHRQSEAGTQSAVPSGARRPVHLAGIMQECRGGLCGAIRLTSTLQHRYALKVRRFRSESTRWLFAQSLLQIIMLKRGRHAINFCFAQSVAERFLAPRCHRPSHFF
jgi:hypothetical protein